MAHFKRRYGTDFEKKEVTLNMTAAFLGGAVGSGLTNAFDVLTINKQTDPKVQLMEIARREGVNLLTKGLLARVYYNSMQSIVFFQLVLHIGKVYDVELSDD